MLRWNTVAFFAGALLLAGCTSMNAPAPAGTPHIDTARIDAALKGLTDSGKLVGVSALVYKDGHQVYFGAFGMADREAHRPMTRDTLVQIWSMTKPITGVALMTLYEQGKFKLDDPISKYIPELANVRVYAGLDAAGQPILVAPDRPITVADITRHTAGLYGAKSGNAAVDAIYAKADPMNLDNDLAQMAKKLGAVPLLYQPGTHWFYSRAVDIQALLIERLSGEKYADYVREKVLAPLKMTHTGYYVAPQDRDRMAAIYDWQPDGSFVRQPDDSDFKLNYGHWALTPGAYGLVSTLDDYSRFTRMLLNGGALDGARILKPETVRLMATDQMPPGIPDSDKSWLVTDKGHVGIDFAVRTAPPRGDEKAGAVGEFFWDGAADTLFWVDPKNDLTAVLFTQYMPFGKVPLHKDFRDAVYRALNIPSALPQ
jgi:CubicO group peptidase (beta-lactamase class C family)